FPFRSIARPVRIQNDLVVAEPHGGGSGWDDDDVSLRSSSPLNKAVLYEIGRATAVHDQSAFDRTGRTLSVRQRCRGEEKDRDKQSSQGEHSRIGAEYSVLSGSFTCRRIRSGCSN